MLNLNPAQLVRGEEAQHTTPATGSRAMMRLRWFRLDVVSFENGEGVMVLAIPAELDYEVFL